MPHDHEIVCTSISNDHDVPCFSISQYELDQNEWLIPLSDSVADLVAKVSGCSRMFTYKSNQLCCPTELYTQDILFSHLLWSSQAEI